MNTRPLQIVIMEDMLHVLNYFDLQSRLFGYLNGVEVICHKFSNLETAQNFFASTDLSEIDIVIADRVLEDSQITTDFINELREKGIYVVAQTGNDLTEIQELHRQASDAFYTKQELSENFQDILGEAVSTVQLKREQQEFTLEVY